ncbi:hypothetical protein T10_12801 [Trichinella papuae]|uniref:Uncharacterized protein n=1 Tax=Trichinella papuae TaxID=268474 RepID=A0A0V1MWK3_9BILA|nr:hypothetical protein T10_12801 [Trichinella papuae]
MLRTVGVHWNREEDEFTYVSALKMSSTERSSSKKKKCKQRTLQNKNVRWILMIQGSSAVKRVLRRCVVCIEENSRCLNQIVGPLSKERLVETHAFDNVGIVFVGPLM